MSRAKSGLGPPAVIVFIALAASFALFALHAGQDVNWDRQNYHIYDAFALLHWRYAIDVMPGGPQTTLNPLPYVLPYLLDRYLGPLTAALVLAGAQSISVFVAWCIARRVTRSGPIAIIAAVVAGSAAMVLAEIGTSFAELLLSIPPLGALLLLVSADEWREGQWHRRLLPAAALTGAAVGFKIVLLPLAIGFAAGVVSSLGRADRVWACSRAALGLALGFLTTGGIWLTWLWWHFSNPFFPFLNNIFHSSSADPIMFGDDNAYFRGVLPALLRPFRAAFVGIPVPFDVPFRDARPLVGILLGFAWLAVRREGPLRFLCVYLVCGEAAWLVLCPVERYALSLDMLAGMVGVLIIGELLPGKLAVGVAAALAAVVIGSTQVSDFFHRPWSAAYVAVPPASLGSHYDLVLLSPPLGYWAAASPPPDAAFGLFGDVLREGGITQKRFDAGLRAAGDRLWAVGIDVGFDSNIRHQMAAHDLILTPPCVRAESMFWVPTVFCHAQIAPARADAASDIAIGERIDFDLSGDGWLYEMNGWDATQIDGTMARDNVAELGIRAVATGPLKLVLTLDASAARTTASLTIIAGGLVAAPILLQPGSGKMSAVVCVGRKRGQGNVILLQFSATGESAGDPRHPVDRAFRLKTLVIQHSVDGECPDVDGNRTTEQ